MPRRERVAIVIALHLTRSAGSSQKAILAADSLKKMGLDVDIYASGADRELRERHNIVEIPRYKEVYAPGLMVNIVTEIKLFFRYFKELFLKLVRRKYKIIQIHSVTKAAPQLAALLAAKLLGSKIVYYYHDLLPETFATMRHMEPKGLAYAFVRIFEKLMCENSDVIIVISDAMKMILMKRIKNRKIFVVYAPVNIDEFSNCEQYRDYLKDVYGLSRDILSLIYLGRLEPKIRGLEDLAKAFMEVMESGVKAYLVLVGDGPLRSDLEKFFEGHKARKYVKILGHKKKSEAVKILCSADIAILSAPKTFEIHTIMPTKILEYMVTGKVIIAPNALQPRILLGKYAVFYDMGDYRHLASCIVYAIKNFDSIKKYAHKLRQRVEQISIEKMIARIQKIYRKFLLN